jgi:RNA polymerase sigma-70 factor (ECF subfamily)
VIVMVSQRALNTLLAPGSERSKRVRTAHGSASSAIGQALADDAPVSGNDLDCTLIAAVAAGDETAFNEIHARYYSRVARFTGRMTGRSELAAEITNDTLWAIWRCARSFKGNSKASTWILGIAYHICSKALSRSRRREAHEPRMEDFIEPAYEPWSDGDNREWVGAAIIRLPQEQRKALYLFYQVGYSCEEIAAMVDCPINTVKTRMYHGRRTLRRLLSESRGSAVA